MGVRALFVDRDGTLMVDTGYVRDPADVALLPGASELIREARALGFEVIVVTNQSGVARGIITKDALEAVERRFEELLHAEGAAVDDVRFCLHGPDDGCACRKPASGLLREASAARGIDLRRSIMLGDRDSDVLAGKGAGCTTIVLGSASIHADYAAASLLDVPPILRRIAG